MSTIDAPRDSRTRLRAGAGRNAKPAAAEPGREAWTLLFQLLRDDREFLVAGWAEFGLTPSQGNLLNFLQPGEPSTMAALARFLGCHDSNVTGLVDRLEARGLVERRNDPADRRVKLVALTETGTTFRAQALARIYDPPPFIVSLSTADRRTLRDILRKAMSARG